MAGERFLTQDHDTIRAWAEDRNGTPSAVSSTTSEEDPGIIRIDFPGYSGEGSLEEISWDEWFEKFDRSDLVLLYQETTSDGETSNFNKLVKEDTAEEAAENARWKGGRGNGGSSGGESWRTGGVELRRDVKPSDEATEQGLELAREQGEAVGRAARHMMFEVAHDGGEQPAGDYIVGYAVEEAEGMYHLEGGELEWREPEDENAHVEVSVRDRDDGRLVPGLDVEATLVSEDGQEIGPFQVPFVWHPSIHHYGINVKVPGDGRYTLRVRVGPAPFPRHDEENGDRYAEGVEVEFEGVEIETGQD